MADFKTDNDALWTAVASQLVGLVKTRLSIPKGRAYFSIASGAHKKLIEYWAWFGSRDGKAQVDIETFGGEEAKAAIEALIAKAPAGHIIKTAEAKQGVKNKDKWFWPITIQYADMSDEQLAKWYVNTITALYTFFEGVEGAPAVDMSEKAKLAEEQAKAEAAKAELEELIAYKRDDDDDDDDDDDEWVICENIEYDGVEYSGGEGKACAEFFRDDSNSIVEIPEVIEDEDGNKYIVDQFDISDMGGVKTIKLPKTIDYVYGTAFSVGDRDRVVVSLADDAPADFINGVFYSDNRKILTNTKLANVGCSFTVAEGVEVIDFDAFEGCQELRVLNLPSTIKTIRPAFSGCVNLERVVIEGQKGSVEFDNCDRDCEQVEIFAESVEIVYVTPRPEPKAVKKEEECRKREEQQRRNMRKHWKAKLSLDFYNKGKTPTSEVINDIKNRGLDYENMWDAILKRSACCEYIKQDLLTEIPLDLRESLNKWISINKFQLVAEDWEDCLETVLFEFSLVYDRLIQNKAKNNISEKDSRFLEVIGIILNKSIEDDLAKLKAKIKQEEEKKKKEEAEERRKKEEQQYRDKVEYRASQIVEMYKSINNIITAGLIVFVLGILCLSGFLLLSGLCVLVVSYFKYKKAKRLKIELEELIAKREDIKVDVDEKVNKLPLAVKYFDLIISKLQKQNK